MALLYGTSRPILQGQNIRPPRGSWFNGQSYWLKLYPELGRSDRSVLVVTMILQFQFDNGGDGGSWTQAEKHNFAHGFVNAVVGAWSEKFRITTTSDVPVRHARDVGVVFEFPYYIDGWHSDDDFELSVRKIPAGGFNVSTCDYSLGNTNLDSEDLTPVGKGATMPQRAAVHEFGHMLGLRDEYSAAAVDPNPHHTGDLDSIMNVGEAVRPRHYAPFAGWLTAQFATAARLTRSTIDYKVDGTVNMTNALL
jgi:hypothetical protein